MGVFGDFAKGLISPVTDIVKEVVTDKDKALELEAKLTMFFAETINDAREHDKASYGNSVPGQVVDFFRGMVRPIITYGSGIYFVYAKVNNIPLTEYDYAIIAGVFTFWFGGRFLGKDIQKR